MAEAVRFELTNGCPLPVFKTGAFNHSATLPFFQDAHRNTFGKEVPRHSVGFGLRARILFLLQKNASADSFWRDFKHGLIQ